MGNDRNIRGIVCEFNPFHRGHARLIAGAREQGAETVVCAMSGNFTQRGEAAVFDKWSRAKCAVSCGADLVLELPVSFAVSGARRFAEGGVALLNAAGCGALVFGSEQGDINALREMAARLPAIEESAALKRHLQEGIGFAAAREKAAAELLGEEKALLLRQPNDILGTEYIRAAEKLKTDMDYYAFRRTGASHRGEGETGYSAEKLRRMLFAGEEIESFIPEEAAALLRRERETGGGPVRLEDAERMVLAVLRREPEKAFAFLPDRSEGIENRLYKAIRQAVSLEELYAGVQSRRYPFARVRRLVLCAFLGVHEPLCESPLYLRVLAANEKGLRLLKNASLPVITKHRDTLSLSQEAAELYEQECRADDLYGLMKPSAASCEAGRQMNFRFPGGSV